MFRSPAGTFVVWMALSAAASTGAVAQTQGHSAAPSGPAPVLMTVREKPEPGAAAAHARLEAEYAKALNAGNGSQYYLGMGAITGEPETLFLSGYSSLEEMEDVHDQDEADMGEKLSSLDEEHDATLAAANTAIWHLRPNLSNPTPYNLAQMRLMEVIHIHVKLGHGPEFANIVKQMREGWMKVDPDFHFSVYQQTFGNSVDDSYMILIPIKTLADLDKHHSLVPNYQKSMGEETESRMLAFESANYNSVESNLYAFTPSMSRLPKSWTKDDADFWNPKPEPTAAPAKKSPATK